MRGVASWSTLTSVLECLNMNVVSAENGKDALHVLRRHKVIDIVLMDSMLPTMDGCATIRAIIASGFGCTVK